MMGKVCALPSVVDEESSSVGPVVDPRTSAVEGTTVSGTIVFPGSAPGKPWGVVLARAADEVVSDPVAVAMGTMDDAGSFDYEIIAVPAGTYVMVAYVDVDESGGEGSTPGDFAGWYGGEGNPPAGGPNIEISVIGMVEVSFSLVQR
jgi:hypothetical protein